MLIELKKIAAKIIVQTVDLIFILIIALNTRLIVQRVCFRRINAIEWDALIGKIPIR